MANVKIVEYVHEYDEPDFEWVREPSEDSRYPAIPTVKKEFTSHVTETYYAVRETRSTWTDAEGTVETINYAGDPWMINGTTLHVYNREGINGLIGLLTKLRDEEFPEEKKEIVTFGD